MKRLISTILTCLLVIPLAIGQTSYTLVEFDQVEVNPRNLNVEREEPFGFVDQTYGGYDEILTGSTAQWSPSQSIPFSFMFNGNSVTQYYASNTGVVTFSNSPGTPPSSSNAAIPSASIPDMSVLAWGVSLGSASTTNDAVITKTFGTAPNRQHWVIWSSATASGLTGQSAWTYWGIVLEEGTNNIYIVDMRTYDSGGGNTALTVGIQVDGSTAVSVAASPNVGSVTTATGGSESLPVDNKIYGFLYNNPQNDIGLVASAVGNVSSDEGSIELNNNHSVTGTVVNYGANAITAYDVDYAIDGGSVISHSVSSVNIAPGSSHDFTHGTPWNPTTGGGTFVDVDMSISNPNGNTDNTAFDNASTKNLFLILGVTATKFVLLEEFSTAPCGYCPDGLLVIDDILATVNNVILAQIHAGFGTDAMTIPEHSQWAADFTGGAPTAMVDRILWEGESDVGFSRSIWKDKVLERLNHSTPVEVIINGTYNSQTSSMDVEVTADFKDYGIPGDYRLNLYIIEDDVTGVGSGYDQRNYYSSQGAAAGGPSHPYYTQPDPIPGYEHSMVIRSVPSTTWGNSGVIPSSPEPGQSYMKNYTVSMNPTWDMDKVYLVAYVSRFDVDPGNRPILNSVEVKATDLGVGIEKPTVNADIEVYPNPANDVAQVSIDLTETSDVTVEVVNTLGQNHTVFTHSATYAAGKQYVTLPTADWSAGVYMVNIRIDDASLVKKLIVTH